jgi:hypothetical protein
MSAVAHAECDEILTFLPGIGEEEYAKRAKLRSIRNAAAAMIAATDSGTARHLAWIASDTVTQALYAPGATDALDELIQFCTRLMLTAMQAEKIDLFGAGQ